MSGASEYTEVRHVFRWDLDKTYLHTNFDTWMDLVRTAVETPEGKRSVPGAAALMRELRAAIPSVVTIVSGSPEQMRNAIEAKLRLDGVQWDEFILKPALGHILRGRLRALRDQIGYKLPALLDARTRVSAHLPETLFGDDAEADALVYSLYADVIAGRVEPELLRSFMTQAGSYPDVIERTVQLASEVTRADPVRRIFIHLDRKSEPGFFGVYGARVVPVFNYLQAALVLVHDGMLSAAAAARLAVTLLAGGAFSVAELADGAVDLVARGHLAAEALHVVGEALHALRGANDLQELATRFEGVSLQHRPSTAPVASIDYLAALTNDRTRWEAARDAAKGASRRRKRRAR